MAAKWDRAQGFKFHFGNAARDLADFLPPDEFTDEPIAQNASQKSASIDLDPILESLDEALLAVAKLSNQQREIGFLLRDLKRSVG
jgi:hypothetical protein